MTNPNQKMRETDLLFSSLLMFLSIAVLLIPLPSLAGGKGGNDEDCLSCHGYKGMVASDKGRDISFHVDKEKFSKSSHGRASCIECHEGLEEVPHKKDLKPLDCARSCHITENGVEKAYSHKEAADAVATTVHSKAGTDGALKKGSEMIPGCTGCHPFDHGSGLPAKDKGLHSILSKAEIIRVCGGCHGREDVLTSFGLTDTLSSYYETFHGKQFKFGNKDMPDCIDCHADQKKGGHFIARVKAAEGKREINCRTDKCHRSAGERLAEFHAHASYDRKRYPAEYYTTHIFRTVVTIIVFSLLGIVFLEIMRKIFSGKR